MAAFARHADEVGFESLLAVEHVAVPVGYESRYPYSDTGRMPLPEACELPDPLDLLAWLAARTQRLRLGTGILVLPEHHPLQLAKRCATIDRLSGGRLFLGVGVGWMREEVAALGIDPDERGTRTDEGIEALRVIWREDEPSFAGRHFAFGPVRSQPKPVQDTIPILVGGHSPAAARRAGRLGDGFFPLGLSGERLDQRWAQVQAAAVDAGRDPASVTLDARRPPRRRRRHHRCRRPQRRARGPLDPHRRSRRAPPDDGRGRRSPGPTRVARGYSQPSGTVACPRRATEQ